jgi:hypothetical protein
MSVREERETLKTALTSALPSGWVVYSGPPESMSVPCVVIAPRSPYRLRLTGTKDEVNLTTLIVIKKGEGSLNKIDDTIDVIIPALYSANCKVDDAVEVVATIEANGVEYLTASIDFSITV